MHKDTLLVGGSQRNVVQVINTEYDAVSSNGNSNRSPPINIVILWYIMFLYCPLGAWRD